MSDLVT